MTISDAERRNLHIYLDFSDFNNGNKLSGALKVRQLNKQEEEKTNIREAIKVI